MGPSCIQSTFQLWWIKPFLAGDTRDETDQLAVPMELGRGERPIQLGRKLVPFRSLRRVRSTRFSTSVSASRSVLARIEPGRTKSRTVEATHMVMFHS